MAYAIIDYDTAKWSFSIKQMNNVGELKLFLPSFKVKNSRKYARRIVRILNEAQIDSLVISEELLKNRAFCEELIQNRKHIITGRRMYKALILRILKDVTFQMNVELPKMKIVMLVDDYTVENADLIRIVAKEVKSLTVVTTDKDRFDLLVKDLYEDYGIILKVVEKNNTNFKNCQILVNVDFPSYDMNKLNVASNMLIICGFAQHYQIKSHFNGIVIRDIDVVVTNNTNNHIDDLSLCEAQIYSYLRRLKENDRIFERGGYQINGYFGENGKITLQDFQKLGKNLLDKSKNNAYHITV